MDSIRKFKSSIQSWKFVAIAIIVINVRGVKDNKGEKQLLIVNGKSEFDQVILAFGKKFKTKYEQLFEAYNEGHLQNGFNQNVTTTTKGDQYLMAQHYTILTKVVDEAIQTHLLQLHNKLSNVQSTFKEVNSYPFLCINFVFQIYTKHQIEPNVHLMINYENYFCIFLPLNLGFLFLNKGISLRRNLVGHPNFLIT
jgi:hypothetical protein